MTTRRTDAALAHDLITRARDEWIEANDPKDGTDVVTPYDAWFYRTRTMTMREAREAVSITHYLLRVTDRWVIARPGCIEDDTVECSTARCDRGLIRTEAVPPVGPKHVTCPACGGTGRIKCEPEDRTLRLAWFDVADDGMICFDYDEPEVRRLPE